MDGREREREREREKIATGERMWRPRQWFLRGVVEGSLCVCERERE